MAYLHVLTNLLGQTVVYSEYDIWGCGEQARQREWVCQGWRCNLGDSPQSLHTFRLGGGKEISYVTYRFSGGDDWGGGGGVVEGEV